VEAAICVHATILGNILGNAEPSIGVLRKRVARLVDHFI
jgi:hypothetical protein